MILLNFFDSHIERPEHPVDTRLFDFEGDGRQKVVPLA
jgi:hypothetical protein